MLNRNCCMTDIKAIEILKNQLEKLKTITIQNHSSWRTQTKSYIITLFGDKSPECDFLSHFSFINSYESDFTAIKRNTPIAENFINNCIETIQHRGLKKKEWKHILITTHPAIFWALFTTLCGGFFVIGQLTANKSNNTPSEITKGKNDDIHKTDLPVKNNSTENSKSISI